MKSRFCPSPTGHLHLGNTRTALFNVLLAQNQSGKFLLRIEDTDKSRSFEHYTQALIDDLRWLGLDWQEGPIVEGPHSPYFQSKRQAIYDEYYTKLIQHKLAYPCFCSDSELAIMRKVQLASGQPPRYDGKCLTLTTTQIEEKVAKGLLPTLRFHVPEQQTVEFTDLVRGIQRFNTNDIGDFIVRRADSTASFIFCNAIDDALMGVTHALRGDDHLTNTPRQLLVLKALGLPAPQYGHIALIVGNDGSPLSKRHGSRSLVELREEGFLPGAVVNYLARLGHSYKQTGYLSLAELAAHFSVQNLGSAPSRFDEEQLLYWQKSAFIKLSDEQAWRWLGKEIKDRVPEDKQDIFMRVIKPNLCFPRDSDVWIDNLFGPIPLDYSPEHCTILINAGALFFETAILIINQVSADFKAFSEQLMQTLQIKGKTLYEPLRVALTNQLHGPEMAGLFALLGAEKIKCRLEAAKDIAVSNKLVT